MSEQTPIEQISEMYFSEKEHAEFVDGVFYRVPANKWFIAARYEHGSYAMPGLPASTVLIADTKAELEAKLRAPV